MSADRAHLAMPTWLTPSRVCCAALAWPGVGCGALAVALDRSWTYAPITAAVVTLGGFGATLAAARLIARASSRAAAALLAVGTLPTLAAASTFALCFAWDIPFSASIGRATGIGIIMAVQAWLIGVPLAIWQAGLGVLAVDHLRAPSHEMRDRILARLGLWIALPSLGLGWLAGLRLVLSSSQVFAWNLGMVVIPLALWAWASVRMKMRRRWLVAIREGRIAGWRIVDLDREIHGIVPLLTPPRPARIAAAARVRVLVETEPAAEPFRDVDKMQPSAFVIDPPGM